MPLLVQLIKWEIQIFLLVLAGLVALKLLYGDINTTGLLYGRVSGRKRGQDKYFSPERVQLLLFTLAAGFYYILMVLDNPTPRALPDIPSTWPALLGGSNSIYLAGKAWARWIAK